VKELVRKKMEIRNSNCIACGDDPPSDIDHIQQIGMGGPKSRDNVNNIWPLCRPCHSFKTDFGLTKLVAHSPHLKEIIILKGWVYDLTRWKWVLPE